MDQQAWARNNGSKTRTDRLTTAPLGMIVLLLLIHLVNNPLSSKSASAGSGSEEERRYQNSAWGFQAQNANPRSGYYVIDTATDRLWRVNLKFIVKEGL